MAQWMVFTKILTEQTLSLLKVRLSSCNTVASSQIVAQKRSRLFSYSMFQFKVSISSELIWLLHIVIQ